MSNQKIKHEREGFTIIEVVLVLAIAGLIFLMVFVALPALQRSQRDTQRRDDMARIATAIDQYKTNNSGKLPAAATCSASKDTSAASAPSGSAGYIKPNNTDTYSNTACRFIASYMNSTSSAENTFTDPDGWFYGVAISDQGTDATEVSAFNHVITIKKYAKCDGEKAVQSSNSRDYAILYKLEGTGTYCSDSQ